MGEAGFEAKGIAIGAGGGVKEVGTNRVVASRGEGIAEGTGRRKRGHERTIYGPTDITKAGRRGGHKIAPFKGLAE